MRKISIRGDEFVRLSSVGTMSEFESIGTYLRGLREQKGLSLEEASEATKVKLENLAAVESDEIAKRVPAFYARKLLKIYGDFLGVDGSAVAERLKGPLRSPSGREAAVVTSLVTSRESGSRSRSFRSALIGVVAVMAAIVLYCLYFAIFYPYSLTVKAIGSAPIKVYRDGDFVWGLSMEAGSMKTWWGRRSITLRIYRPENVEVICRGRKINLPKDGGVIVEVNRQGVKKTPVPGPAATGRSGT